MSTAQTADVHARLGACLLATAHGSESLGELESTLRLRRASGAAPNIIAEAAVELAEALGSSSRAGELSKAIVLPVLCWPVKAASWGWTASPTKRARWNSGRQSSLRRLLRRRQLARASPPGGDHSRFDAQL